MKERFYKCSFKAIFLHPPRLSVNAKHSVWAGPLLSLIAGATSPCANSADRSSICYHVILITVMQWQQQINCATASMTRTVVPADPIHQATSSCATGHSRRLAYAAQVTPAAPAQSASSSWLLCHFPLVYLSVTTSGLLVLTCCNKKWRFILKSVSFSKSALDFNPLVSTQTALKLTVTPWTHKGDLRAEVCFLI